MKKYIIAAALAVAALGAQAATTVEGSKFTDNWSVTLKGGGVMSTGIASHSSYRPMLESRGIIGLELRKQLTPVFGLQHLFMDRHRIAQRFRPSVCRRVRYGQPDERHRRLQRRAAPV